MGIDKGYRGIDYFRIAAAVLVVAIHTGPLAVLSEEADFVLCHIIARVAVPFFLMASGFFMFKDNACTKDKLLSFLKRILILYVMSVLMYIPVNIYNGYFKQEKLLWNILKDIVFDGTMYHLWYLPAVLLGTVIAWLLIKHTGYKRALAVALALYIIGLLGDSYYGAVSDINGFKQVYEIMFKLFDYTRNGIFMAPVFIVMGAALGRMKKLSCKYCVIGVTACLAGMVCEGLLLQWADWQRHTSMYIFLVPLMFFLFSLLCRIRGRRSILCGRMAMVIYIIHPMVIVGVRLIAGLIGMDKWLVENSLIHFVLVLVLSAGASLGILYIIYVIKQYRHKNEYNYKKDRAWMEIDLENLRHNVEVLQKIMPGKCRLMAVVKADAYGHGAVRISKFLNKIGIDAFAVATIDEGIELRRNNIKGKILIFGHTDPARIRQICRYGLTQTVMDAEYAGELNEYGVDIKAEIKLDTGMHRQGVDYGNLDEILKILKLEHLKTEGIYTHLCTADSLEIGDVQFANRQITAFYEAVKNIKERGITLPKLHIQSSYGLLNYPELECDFTRIGIAMYGVLSSYGDSPRVNISLKPVMSVKSRITQIRTLKAGETVGYGRTFTSPKDSRIAVISIGYADGIPREISGKRMYVIIRGHRAPVIGRVCMDVMEADVTDIEEAAAGDIVTVIGSEGDAKIGAEEVAYCADSITNELLSRMGSRLEKVYIE